VGRQEGEPGALRQVENRFREQAMLSFDFIVHEDFRRSLEGDWRELQACYESHAWKSVHVLAGSIVEALLIDGLSSATCSIPHADLLKKELSALIALCKEAGIISDRTAQLSTVIRSFRNLIHPGRMIRLKEKVSEQSATIARSLVEMTVSEVEEQKRKDYGYTAAQIVRKVEGDPTSLPILPHLIRELKPVELNNLLLTVIPDRYFAVMQSPEGGAEFPTLGNLGRCFRIAFDTAPIEIRKAASEKFVAVVKERDVVYVLTYETIFFRGSDLQYLDKGGQELIKAHLLAQLKSRESSEIVLACSGLSRFLSTAELGGFVDALMMMISHNKPKGIADDAVSQIRRDFAELNGDAREIVRKRVDAWIARWRSIGGNDAALNRCTDICVEILGEQIINPDDVPF
jgi:hypothetical protein